MEDYDFSRKLPVGIQDFEKLRKDGCLYVDKTEYVYRLAHQVSPIFLSRPRRFGKSLFLSTLKAYWLGKRELFSGLAIEKLESDDPEAWQEYPVFYFDFNKSDFTVFGAVEDVLDEHLSKWEEQYGISEKKSLLAERFRAILETAVEKTGKRCVVLIDEYDKPLLETDHLEELHEHNKAVYKGFFSTLKSYDGYLKFVFITGVTKFSKVSIFSDLNHLEDISLDERYSGICGITEAEMETNFAVGLKSMAEKKGITTEDCISDLRRMYDGYHFAEGAVGVYNPFSLLSALKKERLGYFWFETGTPTFLIKRLKKLDFDPRNITDGDIYMGEEELMDYRTDNPNPMPLLYQTGYLTIRGYDESIMAYELDYPNDEVKYSFTRSLAPYYLGTADDPRPVPYEADSRQIIRIGVSFDSQKRVIDDWKVQL